MDIALDTNVFKEKEGNWERRHRKRKLTIQVSKNLAACPCCVFIPLSLHNDGQHLYAQVVLSAFPGIVYLTFVIIALGRCL